MSTAEVVRVAILMGSENDLETMQKAARVLDELGVTRTMRVLSAHRTPEETAAFVKQSEADGVQVFIAAAGLAAHLAGAVVAHTTRPVIGVPLSAGTLGGFDALLSTVQMPPGLPVATMAIGGAENAGLYATTILALADEGLKEKLLARRKAMREKVLAADKKVSGA